MAAANTRTIKRRIKSAQNIAQITKAMEMVAASKMKRAQEKALQAKPYASKVFELTSKLVTGVKRNLHPLLRYYPKNKVKKVMVILLSTNKGLCGSLNTNLFRYTEQWLTELAGKEIEFITVGKKGQSFGVDKGKLVADFSDTVPAQQAVASIISLVTEKFLANKVQAIYIVYNDFISALKFQPQGQKLLPINRFQTQENQQKTKDFLVEPSAKKVIDELLPFYLESQLRRAVFEAEASEHSARMIAMKNATDNASDLVNGLTLEYNKLRQEMITNEISDIVTAKASLEL